MKEPRKQYRKEKGIPEPKNVMDSFPTHAEDKAYIEWLETQLPTPTDHKELEESRINAEEDYVTTPISVLAYISKLESQSLPVREWISVDEFKSDEDCTLFAMEWNGDYDLSPMYAVTYSTGADKAIAFESVETGRTVGITHVLKVLPQPPKQK